MVYDGTEVLKTHRVVKDGQSTTIHLFFAKTLFFFFFSSLLDDFTLDVEDSRVIFGAGAGEGPAESLRLNEAAPIALTMPLRSLLALEVTTKRCYEQIDKRTSALHRHNPPY